MAYLGDVVFNPNRQDDAEKASRASRPAPVDSATFDKLPANVKQALYSSGGAPTGYTPGRGAPPGPCELREVHKRDPSGRHITEFEGDCDVWMNQFKGPMRARITAFPLAKKLNLSSG